MLEVPQRDVTLTLRLSEAEKKGLAEISRKVDRRPSQFARWLIVRELLNADIEERRATSSDVGH